MKQQPFFKKPKGATTVVLFIHGITEGPVQFNDLVKVALEEGCAVANLLLPGHGGTGKQFAHSSMAKWEASVRRMIAVLRRDYEQIFLVGHSMGGLLAMWEVIEDQTKIGGIFALALPLYLHVMPQGAINGIKTGLHRTNADDPIEKAAQDAFSIQQRSPFRYLTWAPRYKELFKLCRWSRAHLDQISIPFWAVQSRHDEYVSARSIHCLHRCLNGDDQKLFICHRSGHSYYEPAERQMILQYFRSFLKKYASGRNAAERSASIKEHTL